MKEEKTKVALVTGGNRGIGAGIVEVFAEKGYDIFLVHYGEKEKADAVADIVQNKYGRKCKCMDINLSNSDAAVKILNCVLETYGRINDQLCQMQLYPWIRTLYRWLYQLLQLS